MTRVYIYDNEDEVVRVSQREDEEFYDLIKLLILAYEDSSPLYEQFLEVAHDNEVEESTIQYD